MLNKKFIKGRMLVFAAALSMFVSPVSALPVQAEQTAQTAIEDGVILHAWCWSFDTIRDNMDLIAEAGYTSIQTSPINACKVGGGGDLSFTEQWYYHYQPTDYTIGNYQLGSEAEFAEMCEEAERYGIKIIVDVVANHCSSDYNAISSDFKNIPYAIREGGNIEIGNDDYGNGNRRNITHKSLVGLWDNNTHNTAVQGYIRNYLLRCLELGADGFRYDAAKHIELPNETDNEGNFGSNFWPNVLNNGAEFQYGEILQGSGDKMSGYAGYMDVTGSEYGLKIRRNIAINNVSVNEIMNYDAGVSADKLVTWVESHDNYANAITNHDTSQWMTDEQLKLGWGIIGARAGGTPLFFSRPVGGGGQNWDNRFPELTEMGDRGSNLFFDDEVAAVNKFRNAMVGQNEYLRNPNGDSQILMIERGNKGVVIVNMKSSSVNLSSVTNLANGSYTNQTDNNNTFTVSNGTVTGNVPARSVVVLYGP